jgi:hypothetical protein
MQKLLHFMYQLTVINTFGVTVYFLLGLDTIISSDVSFICPNVTFIRRRTIIEK